jgi:hypothetical protein
VSDLIYTITRRGFGQPCADHTWQKSNEGEIETRNSKWFAFACKYCYLHVTIEGLETPTPPPTNNDKLKEVAKANTAHKLFEKKDEETAPE